eukprot:snap_masked-scaffold_36-processed-gene-2.48-mRNA-1 protein AED:1.00 eAED:1.00 QI:0/-1/0/0/-1/1/1/0/186
MFFEGLGEDKTLTIYINLLNFFLCLNLGWLNFWKLTTLDEVDQFGVTEELLNFRNVCTIVALLQIIFMSLSSHDRSFHVEQLMVEYAKLVTTCLCLVRLCAVDQDLNTWLLGREVTGLAPDNTGTFMMTFRAEKTLLSDALGLSMLILLHTILQVVQGSVFQYKRIITEYSPEKVYEVPNKKYFIV